MTKQRDHGNREYAVGLARAFGGAVLFGYPLMMTMEMWWLGFYIDRVRLLVFVAITLACLVALGWYAGFEQTFSLLAAALDALTAFGVAVIASAALLFVFAIIEPGMPLGEMAGKILLQAIPAALGATVARKQLGAKDRDEEEEREGGSGYAAQLFLMSAGALYLAFNVAPTEEMVLLAYTMTPWHELGLVAASVVLLHVFVYTVGFAGQEEIPEGQTHWHAVRDYTIPGYGIALVVSLYVLFTFGRTDGLAISEIASMTAVLGFPSALGAALARLLV